MIVEEKNIQIKEKLDESLKDLHLSLLREGKPIYVNARGMSMYPFIKNGDRIKIAPINEKEIKIGDIIAINRENIDGMWFLVHRVVKIIGCDGGRIYFTKGDAHKEGLDEPVTIELIAGRISEIQRKSLEIHLELPLQRLLNNIIARLSFKYPKILPLLSGYISLIIEWRLFSSKVKNRLKKGSPLLYNTEELLLTCVRGDLDERLKRKAEDLIKEGVYWKRFTESAMRGGVTILVYNALRTIAPHTRIPQFVFDKLKSGYLFIASKVTSQHKQLLELLKLFAKFDIVVLPLKGTLLSKQLYEDIAMRGLCIDIDLLIKEKDKEKVVKFLEDIGYSFNPDSEVKEWQWQYVFNKSGATIIDLHWDITMTCRSKKRIEGFWNGAGYVERDGVSYYGLKEEELLLYLCAHLVNSNDAFGHLRYICDIDRLLNRYNNLINWDSVVEKARNWRIQSSLYTALLLSKELLDSQMPDAVLNKIRPSLPKRLFINFFANKKIILRTSWRKKFLNVFLSYIFFELIEARSAKEYLAVFKRVFFPPKETIGNRSYISRIFQGTTKLLGGLLLKR